MAARKGRGAVGTFASSAASVQGPPARGVPSGHLRALSPDFLQPWSAGATRSPATASRATRRGAPWWLRRPLAASSSAGASSSPAAEASSALRSSRAFCAKAALSSRCVPQLAQRLLGLQRRWAKKGFRLGTRHRVARHAHASPLIIAPRASLTLSSRPCAAAYSDAALSPLAARAHAPLVGQAAQHAARRADAAPQHRGGRPDDAGGRARAGVAPQHARAGGAGPRGVHHRRAPPSRQADAAARRRLQGDDAEQGAAAHRAGAGGHAAPEGRARQLVPHRGRPHGRGMPED